MTDGALRHLDDATPLVPVPGLAPSFSVGPPLAAQVAALKARAIRLLEEACELEARLYSEPGAAWDRDATGALAPQA